MTTSPISKPGYADCKFGDTGANASALDPSGHPVVCGYGQGADGLWQWLVRRLVNGGGDWIDIWPAEGGREALAQDICVDPSGSILVTGDADTGLYEKHHCTIRSHAASTPRAGSTESYPRAAVVMKMNSRLSAVRMML